MALSEKLMKKLACPVCQGELEYNPQEEKLICRNDQFRFRIVDDIPLLVQDEAEKYD